LSSKTPPSSPRMRSDSFGEDSKFIDKLQRKHSENGKLKCQRVLEFQKTETSSQDETDETPKIGSQKSSPTK
jgi:hypothetical protein